MTVLSYDFEGQTDGTALEAVVDGVFESGSGSCEIDTGQFAHGSASALTRRSSGTFCYFEVEESWEAETTAWARFYLRVSAIPSSHTAIVQIRNGGFSGTVCGEVHLRNSGVLGLRDASFTLRASTTTVLSANTWYRIEVQIVHSTTAGSMTLRLFHGDNLEGDTPDETITFTNRNTSTQSDHWGFGWVSNPGSNVDAWWDELALSDEDWIGPVETSSPPVELAGVVTAAGSVEGSLVRVRDLAGGISAAGSMSAAATIRRALAGGISAEASAAAALLRVRDLAGSVAGVGTVDGEIDIPGQAAALAGTVEAASSLSAALTRVHALAGGVEADSGVAGWLKVLVSVAGGVQAESDLEATLIPVRALAGTVAGAGSLWAGFALPHPPGLASADVSASRGRAPTSAAKLAAVLSADGSSLSVGTVGRSEATVGTGKGVA